MIGLKGSAYDLGIYWSVIQQEGNLSAVLSPLRLQRFFFLAYIIDWVSEGGRRIFVLHYLIPFLSYTSSLDWVIYTDMNKGR